MASSFSSNHCLHKNSKKDESIMYALWRTNRLENERKSDEAPNSAYERL